MAVRPHPLIELAPSGGEAFVWTAVHCTRHLCRRKPARFHASGSLYRRRDRYTQFEIEGVRAHIQMVREDSSDRLDPLCGEHRHQLADGGAEHLPHLAARDGEADDGGLLDIGLDDLWCGQ